jgi:putative N6-adenine-specific DNA methylase
MSKFRLLATAAFGIEAIVAKEIKELGFENVTTENGKVAYDADESGICISNLWLRTADRVYIKMAEFKAVTFEELFQGVKAIPWEEYLPEDAEFPVLANSVKSKLFSLSDCQAISKKAIVEKLKSHYEKTWFKETGSKYVIKISILNDIVSVLLDTSGEGLHKRGYREKGNEAPLKETMAAALLKIARWNKKISLIDPLCGTGTILIEAALMGMNIAPGLNRKFAFESWDFIDNEIWKAIKKEAYAAIDYDAELDLCGYDIESSSVEIARENSELAGVDDVIHFQTRDVANLSTKSKYGYIITNPPYGERLLDKTSIEELYKVMGAKFRELDTWSYYVITSFEGFEKIFGKKSTKNRKLYNGKLKCYFYQYFGPRPPKKKIIEQ